MFDIASSDEGGDPHRASGSGLTKRLSGRRYQVFAIADGATTKSSSGEGAAGQAEEDKEATREVEEEVDMDAPTLRRSASPQVAQDLVEYPDASMEFDAEACAMDCRHQNVCAGPWR